MRDKEEIHTTVTKKAKDVLEDIGGKGGIGNLISKLALQLDGGEMEQIVINKHYSLPRPQDEIISINNDPITALQGGVFKNSITLIAGDSGTGKFSIIANMILELSLSQKSVMLVTPKEKDKVEKALKTIFIVREKKVPRNEEAITLDLKITKPSILYDLAEMLDKFVNKPILVLDHLEELVDFSPQGFNKSEWLFFSSCLRRNEITVIATVSIDKDVIVNNAVLGFDSIFYLTQSPVLMDGKSRLARYIITFKSPKGTIPPTEFLLEKNWQIRLDEKKSAFARLAEQESGSPESLEKIARSSSAKPHAPEEKTEPPVQEEPIAFRILAKNGDVVFDPEESNEAEAPIAKTGPRDASPAEIAKRNNTTKEQKDVIR